MANENKEALNALLNSVKEIIDIKLKGVQFDRTFKSAIWKVNTDGTYKINYLGHMYNVPNALGTTLKVGQNVWVKIPQNVLKNMHICGVC